MPKSKRKRAGDKGKSRRPTPGKAVARGRGPKAKGAKPAARPRRVVAPKKRARPPAKPAPPTAKPAAPPVAAAVPKVAPPVERPVQRKEATRMAETKCPIHDVPDCFKPALDAYVAQAYDGYCTKIDWPFVRIIPKGWKPGK